MKARPAPEQVSDASAPPGTAGQLVYAVGDIHGCYQQLRELLRLIVEDAQAQAGGRCPVLVFVGDYVDRGPASADVLDALCWLRRNLSWAVHFLRGNHEQMMLHWLNDPIVAAAWITFGGDATLSSYGVKAPEAEAPEAELLRARDDLAERMPASHLRFLNGLDSLITIGDHAFVHAGLRPGTPLAEQKEADLLWIRRGFVDNETAHEKIVVHGHSWLDEHPQSLSNRIGIDTGVYATGVLTAVRLDEGKREFLRAEA